MDLAMKKTIYNQIFELEDQLIKFLRIYYKIMNEWKVTKKCLKM